MYTWICTVALFLLMTIHSKLLTSYQTYIYSQFVIFYFAILSLNSKRAEFVICVDFMNFRPDCNVVKAWLYSSNALILSPFSSDLRAL